MKNAGKRIHSFASLPSWLLRILSNDNMGKELDQFQISPNGFSIEHHSHPTMLSLQGKVTNTTGSLINNGDLRVVVSDNPSCAVGVFFDYTYVDIVQNGVFNHLLGSNGTLSLNFNKDYYMCLYLDGTLVSGPTQFRGGQGQVHAIDIDKNDNYTAASFNITGNLLVNSNTLFVDAANNKVGIGNGTPGSKLTVAGVIESTSIGFKFPDGTTQASAATSGPWATSGINIYNINAGSVGIGTQSPSQKLDVKGSVTLNGSLGVGTSTPAYPIDVIGNVRWSGSLQNGSVPWSSITAFPGDITPDTIADDGVISDGEASDTLTINNGVLYAPTSGNAGIGTTTPTQKLDVAGTIRGHNVTLTQNCEDGQILKWQGGFGICGNDTGITAETDPEVGVLATNFHPKWNGSVLVTSSLFDNGNVGVGTPVPSQKLDVNGTLRTQNVVLSANCAEGQVLKWFGSVGICGNDTGITGETDPEVGVLALNYLSKWNGSALVTSSIFDNDNVGIATSNPQAKLDVNGTLQTNGFKMPIAASGGYVLTSDAAGTGNWQPLPSGVNGTGSTNYITKFTAASTVGNSIIFENSTSIGIGTTNPGAKLDVAGVIAMSGFKMASGAANGYVLISDFVGSGSWQSIPQSVNGSGSTNYLPKYSAPSTLSNSLVFESSGNLGIGTTAPVAKLDVNGSVQMTSLKLPTGASSGYLLTSDPSGIGTWQPAPTGLPSGTSGQTLRYNGTGWEANSLLFNNGSLVGIGTSAPLSLLHVQGADPEVRLTDTGESEWGISAKSAGIASRFSIRNTTNNKELFVLMPTGRVRIGDATYGYLPTQAFEIVRNDDDVSLLFHDPQTAWYVMGIDFSDGAKFKINYGENIGDNTQFVMDATGKVGLGKANPAAKLDVNGSAQLTGSNSSLKIYETGNGWVFEVV